MSVRRMLPFVLVNILVSAAVVIGILMWWDARQAAPAQEAAAGPTAQPFGSPPAGAPTPAVTGTAAEAGEDSGPNEPTSYVVESGDTLGSIAAEFDVPVEDILAANGLTDPDILSIGQELVIPVGGLAIATAEAETPAAGGPAPSPIPTLDEPDTGEAIVSINQFISAGDLTEEAVEIKNSGTRPIALLDWRLTTENGRSYAFGQITLFGEGAAVLVHTEAGQDDSSNLYWGLEEPVWAAGDTATLLDADGEVVSSLVVE
ncbi:MAG: LysM peptidoglycan-binding domain-containing protein [Candidatus Promineifilaceae bacterium]